MNLIERNQLNRQQDDCLQTQLCKMKMEINLMGTDFIDRKEFLSRFFL